MRTRGDYEAMSTRRGLLERKGMSFREIEDVDPVGSGAHECWLVRKALHDCFIQHVYRLV
jgi:hypothetical protein